MRLRVATKEDWGWELPPGCRDDDPNAPWNAREKECPECGGIDCHEDDCTLKDEPEPEDPRIDDEEDYRKRHYDEF